MEFFDCGLGQFGCYRNIKGNGKRRVGHGSPTYKKSNYPQRRHPSHPHPYHPHPGHGSVTPTTSLRVCDTPSRVRTFICVNPHIPEKNGELKLNRGDFVRILSIGHQGFWQGKVVTLEGETPQTGWFPSHCVEEVRLRHPLESASRSDDQISSEAEPESRDAGDVSGADVSAVDGGAIISSVNMAAAARMTDRGAGAKTVVLQKGKHGFGFILRGPKSQSTHLEHFQPTHEMPALQYLDVVDKGGMADKAGLKPGDFILQINEENVINASHEHAVRLIKKSGSSVSLRVLRIMSFGTLAPPPTTLQRPTHPPIVETHKSAPVELSWGENFKMAGSMTLPARSKHTSGPSHAHVKADDAHSLEGAAVAVETNSIDSSSTVGGGGGGAVGGAGALSAGGGKLNASTIDMGTMKFASIRSRPSSNRISAAELEEIIASQGPGGNDLCIKSASNQEKPVVKVPAKSWNGLPGPPPPRVPNFSGESLTMPRNIGSAGSAAGNGPHTASASLANSVETLSVATTASKSRDGSPAASPSHPGGGGGDGVDGGGDSKESESETVSMISVEEGKASERREKGEEGEVEKENKAGAPSSVTETITTTLTTTTANVVTFNDILAARTAATNERTFPKSLSSFQMETPTTAAAASIPETVKEEEEKEEEKKDEETREDPKTEEAIEPMTKSEAKADLRAPSATVAPQNLIKTVAPTSVVQSSPQQQMARSLQLQLQQQQQLQQKQQLQQLQQQQLQQKQLHYQQQQQLYASLPPQRFMGVSNIRANTLNLHNLPASHRMQFLQHTTQRTSRPVAYLDRAFEEFVGRPGQSGTLPSGFRPGVQALLQEKLNQKVIPVASSAGTMNSRQSLAMQQALAQQFAQVQFQQQKQHLQQQHMQLQQVVTPIAASSQQQQPQRVRVVSPPPGERMSYTRQQEALSVVAARQPRSKSLPRSNQNTDAMNRQQPMPQPLSQHPQQSLYGAVSSAPSSLPLSQVPLSAQMRLPIATNSITAKPQQQQQPTQQQQQPQQLHPKSSAQQAPSTQASVSRQGISFADEVTGVPFPGIRFRNPQALQQLMNQNPSMSRHSYSPYASETRVSRQTLHSLYEYRQGATPTPAQNAALAYISQPSGATVPVQWHPQQFTVQRHPVAGPRAAIPQKQITIRGGVAYETPVGLPFPRQQPWLGASPYVDTVVPQAAQLTRHNLFPQQMTSSLYRQTPSSATDLTMNSLPRGVNLPSQPLSSQLHHSTSTLPSSSSAKDLHSVFIPEPDYPGSEPSYHAKGGRHSGGSDAPPVPPFPNNARNNAGVGKLPPGVTPSSAASSAPAPKKTVTFAPLESDFPPMCAVNNNNHTPNNNNNKKVSSVDEKLAYQQPQQQPGHHHYHHHHHHHHPNQQPLPRPLQPLVVGSPLEAKQNHAVLGGAKTPPGSNDAASFDDIRVRMHRKAETDADRAAIIEQRIEENKRRSQEVKENECSEIMMALRAREQRKKRGAEEGKESGKASATTPQTLEALELEKKFKELEEKRRHHSEEKGGSEDGRVEDEEEHGEPFVESVEAVDDSTVITTTVVTEGVTSFNGEDDNAKTETAVSTTSCVWEKVPADEGDLSPSAAAATGDEKQGAEAPVCPLDTDLDADYPNLPPSMLPPPVPPFPVGIMGYGRNGNGSSGIMHRPSSLVLPILEECETPNADDTPKSVEDIIKKFDPTNVDVANNNNDEDLPPPPDYNDNAATTTSSITAPPQTTPRPANSFLDAALPPPPEFSELIRSNGNDFTKPFVDEAENSDSQKNGGSESSEEQMFQDLIQFKASAAASGVSVGNADILDELPPPPDNLISFGNELSSLSSTDDDDPSVAAGDSPPNAVPVADAVQGQPRKPPRQSIGRVTSPSSGETTAAPPAEAGTTLLPRLPSPPPQHDDKAYKAKEIESWDDGDVVDWLDSLMLGEHASRFRAEGIDGGRLMMLSRNDFIELGVTRVGHRMTIERSLKRIQMQMRSLT